MPSIGRSAQWHRPFRKFDRPIHYVDQTLVKGIDKLEVIAPIIKEQPHEIYNQAKNKVIDVVQPHRSKICALRVAGLGTISAMKLSTIASQTAAQMNGGSSSTVGGHVVTTHMSTVTTSSINTSTNSPAALILPATVPPTPPHTGYTRRAKLGDTLFIVLRKQPLIFLHWYHHVTVLIYSCFSYTEYTASARWFIVMNYCVHSVMYSYYALKAARFNSPRFLAMVITS